MSLLKRAETTVEVSNDWGTKIRTNKQVPHRKQNKTITLYKRRRI